MLQQTQLLLIIEMTFLATMLIAWFIRRRNETRQSDLQSHAAGLRKSASEARKKRRAVGRRVAPEVPIPWGWPNCERYREREKPTVSEAMHNLAWVLTHEKQLASERAADPRIINSVRALLEDRYHRVNREQMPVMAYEKVKPPLLRDPSEPHDQMDNFGRQQSINTNAFLENVGPVETVRAAADAKYRKASAEIRELKRPWGW